MDLTSILFEDNHLIVINKKPSEIVQGDKTGDKTMPDTIKEYLKVKYNKPGNVFCGVIHRLDRPTSGAVVFARTSKGLERMNAQFREKETNKVYWAIVEQKPEKPEGALVHFLKKNDQRLALCRLRFSDSRCSLNPFHRSPDPIFTRRSSFRVIFWGNWYGQINR